MSRRVVLLDTETTGFSPVYDRIVELAALEVDPRTGRIGTEFHHVLNPERSIPPETTKVHGLSDQDVRDKPTFPTIADDFVNFIAGTTLLIHNSGFDVPMLDAALARAKKPPIAQLNISVIDTVEVAKATLPLLGSYNLDALCDAAGVDRNERTTHGALLDIRLLARTLPYLAIEYDTWDAESEPECGREAKEFIESLNRIAAPLLAESTGTGADVAHDLGAVVTLHRWLVKAEEQLKSACEPLVPESGWHCKHLFARFEGREIYNYKSAVEALLVGVDLSAYQSKSFVYRVAPSLNDEVQNSLSGISALLTSPVMVSSRACLIRALLLVKRLKRNVEKQRETLRRIFLQLTQEGFSTDLVAVTESARNSTDYRRAIEDLAPDAPLEPYGRVHRRLVLGERSLQMCATVFGNGTPEYGVQTA